MENAAEALKMAADVLIFMMALAISINAFGSVKSTAQIILDYKDREYDYSYVQENQSTTRKVGVETIVPSIYKAYKENYKIVFMENDVRSLFPQGLYQKKGEDGNYHPVYTIDLEHEVLGSDSQKEEFILGILYGASQETITKRVITYSNPNRNV